MVALITEKQEWCMWVCFPVAILGTNILIPCHIIKSPQLIQGSFCECTLGTEQRPRRVSLRLSKQLGQVRSYAKS